MRRELTPSDALDAVWGGSVLASGGGGWVDHGLLMGELATRVGRPVLCTADELDDGDVVVTVTAIGAPAAPTREIRPLDYVRALQLVAGELDYPVEAVMTAQNGSSTTLERLDPVRRFGRARARRRRRRPRHTRRASSAPWGSPLGPDTRRSRRSPGETVSCPAGWRWSCEAR